jgi:hypothetical protein
VSKVKTVEFHLQETPLSQEEEDKIWETMQPTPIPVRELMLRITTGISSKYEKFVDYSKKDPQNNVIRIIAVNSRLPDVQAVDFLSSNALQPFLARTLFPIGNPQYSYDENDCQNGEWSYVYEPSIMKNNGASVPKTFTKDMSIISGILFYHQQAGDEFNSETMVFFHNPNSSNPAPEIW